MERTLDTAKDNFSHGISKSGNTGVRKGHRRNLHACETAVSDLTSFKSDMSKYPKIIGNTVMKHKMKKNIR